MGACVNKQSDDRGKKFRTDCLNDFLFQKDQNIATLDKIRTICTKFQSFYEDNTLQKLQLSPESESFVRLISYILANAHGVSFITVEDDDSDQKSIIFTKESCDKAKELKEIIDKIKEICAMLKAFNNDSSRIELIFSHELCEFERFVIHESAKNYGMTSFSTGEEEERYVTVHKKS